MDDRLLKDKTPATMGLVYQVMRTLSDLIRETHGGKIAALEKRIADLEEQATRP